MPSNAPEEYQNNPGSMPRTVGVDRASQQAADEASRAWTQSVKDYTGASLGVPLPVAPKVISTKIVKL